MNMFRAITRAASRIPILGSRPPVYNPVRFPHLTFPETLEHFVGQPILANAAYFFHEPAPPWTDSVGIHHCLEFTLRPYGGRNRGLGRCPGSILTWVKRFRMCWLKYLPLDSAFSNS